MGAHRLCDLLLQGGGALGAVADRPHQLAGDPHAGPLLGAGELSGNPLQPEGPVQAAGRQLQLGPEVVQMPAQALLVFRSGLDQILAVVEQQPQLKGVVVEMGGGQGFRALAQSGPGDSESVDRVGLATSSFPAAALPHQLRGDWRADAVNSPARVLQIGSTPKRSRCCSI
jgi:hypothetical protein